MTTCREAIFMKKVTVKLLVIIILCTHTPIIQHLKTNIWTLTPSHLTQYCLIDLDDIYQDC